MRLDINFLYIPFNMFLYLQGAISHLIKVILAEALFELEEIQEFHHVCPIILPSK